MKTLGNKRAQMRVIETILASFILIFAIAFLNIFSVNPRSSTYEVGDLEKLGYNVLHDLDEKKLLDRFVYNPSEWAVNLTAALRVSFPPDVYFNLTIYNINATLLNSNTPISYGDAKVFSGSTQAASVTYILVGNAKYDPVIGSRANYDPRILRLVLTRG